MLALCLMLSGTYYAKNYAGIIGRGLLAEWMSSSQQHSSLIASALLNIAAKVNGLINNSDKYQIGIISYNLWSIMEHNRA